MLDMGNKRDGLSLTPITIKDGIIASHFAYRDGDSHINGVFVPERMRIFVWGIVAGKAHRGKQLVDKVVDQFRCHSVTFTPLINSNIAGTFRGKVKTMKADHPENPYGEDFKYMECDWR